MLQIFRVIVILLVFAPSLALAEMTQKNIDSIYTKPIFLDGNHKTINIALPVDSTDGYRWFLVSPDYDYIRPVSYEHESANIEKSKYGGLDSFKLRAHDRFKKAPQKIILHFECFRPFESNPKILKKDIIVLSLLN